MVLLLEGRILLSNVPEKMRYHSVTDNPLRVEVTVSTMVWQNLDVCCIVKQPKIESRVMHLLFDIYVGIFQW